MPITKTDIRERVRNELATLEPRMCPLLYTYIKRVLPLKTKELKSIIAVARDNINFTEYLAEYVFNTKATDLKEEHFNRITLENLLNYEEYLTDIRHNATNTQARKITHIKKFFRYLYSDGAIKKNITTDWSIKKVKVTKIQNRLDSSEVKDMINCIVKGENIASSRERAAHERYALRDSVIFILLAYTGIRISELISLDIENVNIRQCFISVTRKGNKIQELPYPNYVSNILEAYIEERRNRSDVPSKYKDALFISSHKKRLTEQSVRKLLKKYSDRTDITEKITCHTLRRTCLNAFYNSTGDIRATQQLAGHSNPSVTAEYYAAVDDERFRNMISSFDYS